MLGENTAVVCVMSGNFVQRGECACYSKFARAHAAVLGGADLVLELPLPWAISSAERFARGAVAILAAAGIVTHLSFGSEEGSLERLEALAKALEAPELDELIRAELASGISYAAAREQALQKTIGADAQIIKSPNNILAIEYIKAIRSLKADITPITVMRKGAGHDSAQESEMPSASRLRTIMSQGQAISSFVPKSSLEILENEAAQGRGPVTMERLELPVLSRLRMLSQMAFNEIPDAGEGSGNRLYAAVREGATLEEILDKAKTKRYARSRLRRMCLCAALGVSAQVVEGLPPYLRVLAANETGRALLHEMSDAAALPIVTKPAGAKKLSSEAQSVFYMECAASDLFVLGFQNATERRMAADFRTSPIMV